MIMQNGTPHQVNHQFLGYQWTDIHTKINVVTLTLLVGLVQQASSDSGSSYEWTQFDCTSPTTSARFVTDTYKHSSLYFLQCLVIFSYSTKSC